MRDGDGSDQPEADHPDLGWGLVRRSSADDGLLGQDHEVECHWHAGDHSVKLVYLEIIQEGKTYFMVPISLCPRLKPYFSFVCGSLWASLA